MNLSIITITFNSEKCIEKTMNSVLKQKKPIYEYVFIDGGSTDRTNEIIENYRLKFESNGTKVIHISEKDKGISDAFNKGIKHSTGDLIGIINSDDELMPDTSLILEKIWNEVDSDIYYGNCLWVDEKKKIEYISKPKSSDYRKLLYRMILIHPSTFVRKSTYEKCGTFDISYRYCMDKELLYRMYKLDMKFHYIDKTLTKFKAGGVSDTNAVKVFKEGSRMAIENGEPKIKVMLIEYEKRFYHWLVCKVKKTFIFDKIKKIKKL